MTSIARLNERMKNINEKNQFSEAKNRLSNVTNKNSYTQDFITDFKKRKFIKNFFQNIDFGKILILRQVFFADKLKYMRSENQDMRYCLRFLEQTVQHELATKNDVVRLMRDIKLKTIKLRGEMIVISNNVQNGFADMLTKFKKINSVESASALMNNNKKNSETLLSNEFVISINQSFSRDFLDVNQENKNIDVIFS